MKEYNVLDPSSTLYGQIFIEASAGTGKTFAIEHMVLRLILGGMCISEILVVTFTKAGAGDLKRRIHTSLLQIAEILQGNDYTLPYLAAIEDKEAALFYIQNARALSSEMPVCTIHSFAFQMLSSFTFEAGVDFDLLHFEDEKQKDLLLTAILDTLRTETSEDTISSAQCTKMMDYTERKLSLLTKYIASLIENEKHLTYFPSYSELKTSFDLLIPDHSYERLEDEFFQIAPLYKKTTNRQKEIHPNLISQVKALAERDLDRLILEPTCIIELLQEEHLKKGATLPDGLLFPRLMKQILPIWKVANDPNTPITHIAIKAKKRLEQLCVKSPDAILASMKEAIKKPAFKEKVSNLYTACIIDEFQDTDPLQWEILSSLFFTSTKTFCTVGDPKQSIYAFRGADLPTYLLAKKFFSSHFSLDTNYRSNKALISVLNNLFSEKNTPGFLAFEENSKDLTYHEVKAGKKDLAKSSAELLLCPPPKKKTVRASLMEAENLYFFPHIAETIKALHLPLDTIAILVKDRYQGLAISIFLEQMNIPAKASISSSLLESPLFSLFETLLLLAYTPRSESLIKKLLTHSFINAPIDLLKEDLSNQVLQQLSIDFSILHSILENNGIHAFLFALLDMKIFSDQSLGELLCKSESSYLTMMQIFSLFLTHFDKDPKLFLSQIQKLNSDVFTFLKKGCATDKKSVTIMTSHLSKGLEFEAVFALSLYTRMKLTPKSEEEAILSDKEKMRLLYVTLTRAKSHLFIYGTLFGSNFPLSKGCGSPLELFLARVHRPFLSYTDLYKVAESLTIDQMSNLPILTKELAITLAKPWEIKEENDQIFPPETAPSFKKPNPVFSFSSLPFEKHPYTPIVKEAEFPYGAKVGHQIHLIFEKIIEEGLYYPFTRELIYPVIEKSFFQTNLAGFEELIFQKIEEIFKMPLTSLHHSFSLESIPPHHMWGEVEFFYSLEDTSFGMKGFADLIIYYDGKYYILDWKCNHLDDYSQEGLKQTLEHHHYTKQASIYTKALQSFLTLKNLPFKDYAGGAFYIFVRAGKEGAVYFRPEAMNDKEILCLK